MKKLFYYLSVATLLLAFTGCQKDDQSSLDLGSIKTTGTLTGVAYYDGGYTTNPLSTTPYLVAANKTIIVTVDLSDYDSNSTGIKTYEIVTDAAGKFSLEVPVAEGQTVGASVSISFAGVQNIQYPVGVAKALNGVFNYNASVTFTSAKTQVLNIFVSDFSEINETGIPAI